jgi:hypothetical protein
MYNKSARLRWSGILVVVFAVLFMLNSSAVFGTKMSPEEPVAARADIIRIDSMSTFGKLEKSAVTFFHQQHTDALEKKNKQCSACHLSRKDPLLGVERMSNKFMRLEDTTRQEVMDLYHANCIDCHKETKAAGEKSGPQQCGQCHFNNTSVVSNWKAIGMDKSLHYIHSKAQDNKCEKCHHEYNKVTKKLFFAKGKEGTCRYCHQQILQENVSSFKQAAHIACIDCHRRTLAKDESAGPYHCAGCHDPAEQKLIKKVQNVPRLKRGQPDVVFIKDTNPDRLQTKERSRMKRVVFNHKGHEASNDTCRVCHHAAMNDCIQCHNLQGEKKGQFVTLEQSMHRPNAGQSCLGCHGLNQSDPNCAGCHSAVSITRRNTPDTCVACHVEAPSQNPGDRQADEDEMLAASLLSSRPATGQTYAVEDIPETVLIKTLQNEYEPVKLPHRKIVQTLVNNIKGNKLAGNFHDQEGWVCQSCHHNSPAAKKPPACESCHVRRFDGGELFKPELKAAYHVNCNQCHQAMGMKKPVSTDCTACHLKKIKT